jgi:hypothetical protein
MSGFRIIQKMTRANFSTVLVQRILNPEQKYANLNSLMKICGFL